MEVIFSNYAFNMIVSESTTRIESETGGIFLGCYEDEIWYVIESINPGPRAVFQESYFEYDQQYVQNEINRSAQKYQAILTLIGVWHKHPGSNRTFSIIDDITNKEYAKLTKYGTLSILVNMDPDFNMTPYHITLPLVYTIIDYKVGDELIPKYLFTLK